MVIYEKPYFTGKSRTVTMDARDFMTRTDQQQTVFMYTVGSLKVLGGMWVPLCSFQWPITAVWWQLCLRPCRWVGYEKEGFRGHQYLLEEGEYHDWRTWGGCDVELRSARIIRAVSPLYQPPPEILTWDQVWKVQDGLQPEIQIWHLVLVFMVLVRLVSDVVLVVLVILVILVHQEDSHSMFWSCRTWVTHWWFCSSSPRKRRFCRKRTPLRWWKPSLMWSCSGLEPPRAPSTSSAGRKFWWAAGPGLIQVWQSSGNSSSSSSQVGCLLSRGLLWEPVHPGERFLQHLLWLGVPGPTDLLSPAHQTGEDQSELRIMVYKSPVVFHWGCVCSRLRRTVPEPDRRWV